MKSRISRAREATALCFAAMLLIALLASCQGEAPVTGDGREKLWTLEVGHGFELVFVSHTITYGGKGAYVTFNVLPKDGGRDIIPEGAEPIGGGYFAKESKGKGKGYRALYWERAGYVYQLTVQSDAEDIALAIASRKVAERWTHDPAAGYEGLRLIDNVWLVQFQRGKEKLHVYLYDLPPISNMHLRVLEGEGGSYEETVEGGIQYYDYDSGVKPDGTIKKSVYWYTDKGLFWVSAYIHAAPGNAGEEKGPELINMDFIKQITGLVGAKFLTKIESNPDRCYITNAHVESKEFPVTTLVQSREELEAYYEAHWAGSSKTNFLYYAEKYNDAYFAGHNLLLAALEEPMDHKCTHSLNNVMRDGNDITIKVEHIISPLTSASATPGEKQQCHMFIELKKEDCIGATFRIEVYDSEVP